MLHVFVKVCCLCQCWCMEYAGCFWGFAVWIWSTWSSFVSCGILRGKFSECCARRWDALGERGARVGCGVGAMWHQAWPIKTARQKQSNNWWIHFSCILSISFVSVFPVSSTYSWTRHGFSRQRCKRGSFYPAPQYEVCWRWRCCAMIWPGTFWMSMGRRNGVLRFF